jgi:hypothetical protein
LFISIKKFYYESQKRVRIPLGKGLLIRERQVQLTKKNNIIKDCFQETLVILRKKFTRYQASEAYPDF